MTSAPSASSATSPAARPDVGRAELFGFVGASTVALVKRPWLISTAVRQMLRMAPSGWWKRPPFLPVPSREYMKFRSETLSGASDELPSSEELIVWLEWCRSMNGLPST